MATPASAASMATRHPAAPEAPASPIASDPPINPLGWGLAVALGVGGWGLILSALL